MWLFNNRNNFDGKENSFFKILAVVFENINPRTVVIHFHSTLPLDGNALKTYAVKLRICIENISFLQNKMPVMT